MEVISIKDLPELERPREKAKHYGIDKLSNIELLALLIGSGNKNNNIFNIATNLIKKANGIDNILNLNLKDYLSVQGIKEATAFRFLAISELLKRKGLDSHEINYNNSYDIAKKYRFILGNSKNESMYLIALNSFNKVIYERELYKGTKKNLISDESEIIAELIKEKAKSFILVHNHPSGNITPSQTDIVSTNHLKETAKNNKLNLLDHIIVGDSDLYTSLKDENMLI